MIQAPAAAKETALQKPRIVRDPYLQLGTETGIIIGWATDAPVLGKVIYGTETDRLTATKAETAITCNHHVQLSGLKPDQKYYYAVGSDTEVHNCQNTFITAPASSESADGKPPQSFRIQPCILP